MKTYTDIINLIVKEVEMSKGKYVQYSGTFNWEYKYVSFFSQTDNKKTEILTTYTLDTPAKIQQAYWTIWNSGRSRHEDNKVNIEL